MMGSQAAGVEKLLRLSFDLYQLKKRYRYLLSAFLIPGLFAGVVVAADWAHGAQIAMGLTPGAPLGSEPGSVFFLCLSLALGLGAGLIGMALGGLLLCVVLAALRRLSFRDSVRAVFLSHFPRGWFRVEKAESE